MVSRREFVVLCGHRQRALRGNWSVIRFPIVHCRYVPRHVFNLARIHSPQTSRKRKWLINRREPRWINATVFSPPRSCYAWKSSEISFERGSVKKKKKREKMKFSFFFDSIERDDRRGSMMDYRGSHGWMLYYYSSLRWSMRSMRWWSCHDSGVLSFYPRWIVDRMIGR